MRTPVVDMKTSMSRFQIHDDLTAPDGSIHSATFDDLQRIVQAMTPAAFEQEPPA